MAKMTIIPRTFAATFISVAISGGTENNKTKKTTNQAVNLALPSKKLK
jgi:hypothetical protein